MKIRKTGFESGGTEGEGPDKDQAWEVRVVLEIADPLLASEEIRQALGQLQLTEGDMRAFLSEQAENLICFDELTFIEPIDWDRVFELFPRRWLASAALAILGGVFACLVLFVGWVVALPILAVLSYQVGQLATRFILTRSRLRKPLTPTAESSDRLRRRAIGPFIRWQLNRILDERDYPVELRVRTAPGLAELTDREQVVWTDASDRLARLSGAMPTGNIGISGPRGAGKTTLLRFFCDATLKLRGASDNGRTDLRFMVSAPVDYDAREFILHLFARLCETVLAYAADADPARRRRRRRPSLIIIPGSALAAVGAVVIGWGLLARARRLPHLTSLDAALLTGGMLLVIGAGLLLAGAMPADRRAEPEDRMSLLDEARIWQTRLRYLQAFTTGYSGTVGLGALSQLQASTARQLTEQPLALPDLVDAYRSFAARTALSYRLLGLGESAGRLVIGIDELDKIGSAEASERFINDIKAIFGIPHCLYLVSVSDDALTAFEQRAFVARTALDNAFDEVVRAGYLDYEAAGLLLQSRVAGLPQLVIALCHVLSGGLPRDLIRATRSVINASSAGSGHITSLCEAMVAAEVETLKSACLATLAAEPDRLESSGMLPALLDRSWPGASAKELLKALDHDLSRLVAPRNFCAAIYFYATVAEVFGPGLTATTEALRARHETYLASETGAASGTGDADIDKLARARSSLSGNPDIAWELLTRFRVARGFSRPARPWQSGNDMSGRRSIP